MSLRQWWRTILGPPRDQPDEPAAILYRPGQPAADITDAAQVLTDQLARANERLRTRVTPCALELLERGWWACKTHGTAGGPSECVGLCPAAVAALEAPALAQPMNAFVQWGAEAERLREIVMSAHALRCVCGRTADLRCEAIQQLAAPPAPETHHDLTRPIWKPEDEQK